MVLRSLLSICLMCYSLVLYGDNFPKKDVELLIGKEIKVLPKSDIMKAFGYSGFYVDFDLKNEYAATADYSSKYEELVGKVFNVVSYDPFVDVLGKEKFILTIENEQTGTLYFAYDPDPFYESLWPFEVIGGLTYSDEFLCKEINERKDKFTGNITYHSPIIGAVTFLKLTEKSTAGTYIKINVTGTTINVDKRGAIILLENGETIEKPDAKIEVNADLYGNYYEYSTLIKLTEDDIIKLKQHIITDVRLYIYDREVSNGAKLKGYLKCITKK